MESVAIEIPRRRSVRGGDRCQVFGDGGTGVIDMTSPLTDRPLPYWEGLPEHSSHLLGGHLAERHLDNVAPDGHLSGRHLTAEHLWPARSLVFVTRPFCFGLFGFAVEAVDGTGNRSSTLSEVVRCMVNSAPRPAEELAKSAFDPVTRRLTFTFTPSPDL
jgi:hypothetical protein